MWIQMSFDCSNFETEEEEEDLKDLDVVEKPLMYSVNEKIGTSRPPQTLKDI